MKETRTIASSFFWKILENGGSQGVSLGVSILLARLLSPEDYGALVILLVFINIANVLIQNGFATALIQKKEASPLDFSSVLWFQLFLSAVLYLLLFVSAPFVADFYHNPQLKNMLRILALLIFPGGVISVESAWASRRMAFRSLCLATVLAAVFSGTVSIVLAARGWKTWALCMQQLVYYFSLMIFLAVGLPFRFSSDFCLERLRSMFSFGYKILAAALIDTLYNNLHGLVIGKVYSPKALGDYNEGEMFPKLIVGNLSGAIQSVLLPVMAREQEEVQRVKELLKRSLSLSTYLIVPMMWGLAASSQSLVLVLLGEKWHSAVPFLRVMCAAYAFWPMHISHLQALKAMGKSRDFLVLEILKKTLGLGAMVLGIRYSVIVFVGLKAVMDFVCVFINAWPNVKNLSYPFREQAKDVAPSFFLSTVMGLGVYALEGLFTPGLLLLGLQILGGIGLYLALSWGTKNRDFIFLWNMITNGGRKKVP